jgi:hypothetical protein
MILKSDKYLGDTIHAYMVVKNIRDAGFSAYLSTNSKFSPLFDPNYLIDNNEAIDFDFSSLINCRRFLTDKTIHVRDDIAKNFTDLKSISHSLHILPYSFENKTVVICNRSTKRIKEWKGKWNNIIDYLTNDGYSIIFDNPTYDLETIVSYVAGANLVIAIDTGLIHVADAYGIPVIGLYGTKLNRYHPYMNHGLCIEMPLDRLSPQHIIDKINELKLHDKYGLSDFIESKL